MTTHFNPKTTWISLATALAAITVIGAAFWWAATVTNDIEYIKQDLAIIKSLITTDHIVKK